VIHEIGPGVYRVEEDGRSEVVYVAGPPDARWAFWNGRVFRPKPPEGARSTRSARHGDLVQPVTAPMPATVLKVVVKPGATVRKGDTVIVLEAMKMELPVRASSDAIVRAVHCREGDLVAADAVLAELE
jgi:biotin carboxyl carrier protein